MQQDNTIDTISVFQRTLSRFWSSIFLALASLDWSFDFLKGKDHVQSWKMIKNRHLL